MLRATVTMPLTPPVCFCNAVKWPIPNAVMWGGMSALAPLASLTDHEEQVGFRGATGAPSRHWRAKDNSPAWTHTSGFLALRATSDDSPANREKRVPGFRSTKTPTHHGQTSRTSVPILPVVDQRDKVVEQLPHPNGSRWIVTAPWRVKFTQYQPHRRPVRTFEECWRRLHQWSPMAEHLL